MIILYQNILFLKEFIACNGCFGLFTKNKKGSGTSFCGIFLAWLFHKNVPNTILSNTISIDRVSMPYLFSFYLPSSSKAIATKKKKKRMEIQIFEYLKNENSFLDERKSIFCIYLRAIIWWKMKNSRHRVKDFFIEYPFLANIPDI